MKRILILVAAYFAAYLMLFWQTPLGMEPVLDGAENFKLSQQICDGTLPAEPFFRSMLYPAILALFRIIGFTSFNLMYAVGAFGLLLHVLGTYLAFVLADMLWKNKTCSYLAAILYGFYPPMIFFAAEPLDAVFSCVMLLASVVLFLKACESKQSKLFVYSGLLMGLCFLARSNCLPAAIIFLYEYKITKKSPRSIIALLSLILIGGIAGYLISGQFRVMPWQGAYALYAANNANSNGKYYQNTIDVSERKLGVNPARTESEKIYNLATGKKATDNVNEFNKFWYNLTLNSIKNNFSNWLKLICKKTYYLFNNFEQYNNKTFSYHKENSSVLAFNPLCFGIILTMFFLTVFSQSKSNRLLNLLYTALLMLSLGIIAFYVSGRFRLMLLPIMIPVSAGFIKELSLRSDFKKVFFKSGLIMILASFLTFSSFLNANDKSTYIDDMMLTAFAASRIGLLEEQVNIAQNVLLLVPNHIQAARLILSGTINQILANIHNKIDYSSLTYPIRLLRNKELYYDDTILMDLWYSLGYEKDFRQVCINLSRLPSEQFQFLPIMLLCIIVN